MRSRSTARSGAPRPGLVDVAGTLEQRKPDGSFSVEVACTPDSTDFAAPVTTVAGAFMPGRATVTSRHRLGLRDERAATRGSLVGSEGTAVKLHP